MSQPNHRIRPGSVRHRQMVRGKGSHMVDDSKIPADIRAHNEAIDAAKAAKKVKKHNPTTTE